MAIATCIITPQIKEIAGIHNPCILPHSNDSSATTEYKPVQTGLYSNVTPWWTSSVHITLSM